MKPVKSAKSSTMWIIAKKPTFISFMWFFMFYFFCFVLNSAPLCQGRAICTSWSPTPVAGWGASSWSAGLTFTCTAARGTTWSEPSSTCRPLRWNTAKTSRLYCEYVRGSTQAQYMFGHGVRLNFCVSRVLRLPTRLLFAPSTEGSCYRPPTTRRCMTGCTPSTLC